MEERIILIRNLGYFSNQHLYLNYSSIINCYLSIVTFDEEDFDEESILIATTELLNIASSSKNQLVNMLTELAELHKDDVLFFKNIIKGYTILIDLASILCKFTKSYSGGDTENFADDFQELATIAQTEIGKIVGYIK